MVGGGEEKTWMAVILYEPFSNSIKEYTHTVKWSSAQRHFAVLGSPSRFVADMLSHSTEFRLHL